MGGKGIVMPLNVSHLHNQDARDARFIARRFRK